eukprot:c1760_g1_i1.p1 GENE.c1760_g1_i1~~c1760_g1_i1.p1  ORF type:complete len:135 (+),score=41.38 c1760_g1_i1:33-407(+)
MSDKKEETAEDPYRNVLAGKLKLKKPELPGGKKKKRKVKVEAEVEAEAAAAEAEAEAESQTPIDPHAHMTKAEYRYELERKKIEAKNMKSLAKSTHRDRVKDFNDKLDRLPQHFDLPKVALTIG